MAAGDRVSQAELFAYSCEAFGRIVQHARDRRAPGQQFVDQAHRFTDEDVPAEELASIVGEACEARNGWKVVLRRCAAAKMTQREVLARLP